MRRRRPARNEPRRTFGLLGDARESVRAEHMHLERLGHLVLELEVDDGHFLQREQLKARLFSRLAI